MAKDSRHYRMLSQQLARHVDPDTQTALLAGMDYVTSSSKPDVRVGWAREMMAHMEGVLDPETCITVREGCACVLSNENSIYARMFRKLRKLHPDDDDYIDEVTRYLNATEPLRRCGDVTRDGDRIISVIARGRCDCPVLHAGLHDPISRTWCQCSKGSLLSVYRTVFPDRMCEMEIISTVASGGDECRFATTYRREEE